MASTEHGGVSSGPVNVVVSDLHVDYRVHASGKTAASRASLLTRQRGTRIVHALRGVSVVVHEGETIGVIGRNGSGKSTLMRAIAGLQPATTGAVYAASRPALLGINAALLPTLSGEQNVLLGALALGHTPQEVKEKYDEIVEFSGLGEFIALPMKTYSSGMQARLRFSIAVSRAHQILLIDEALSAGDQAFRARSEDRIRALREDAGTVILVTHSMRSILDTCTRVIWIDAGQIVADGAPEDVVAQYRASK